MRRISLVFLVAATSVIGLAVLAKRYKQADIIAPVAKPKPGPFTVEQRLAQYGEGVATRLSPMFAAVKVEYPPYEIAYVAFKDQRQLQVYARNASAQRWTFVKQYPILAASGKPGPKLMEGDRQVPEGSYKAEFLNANSRFHLSIRLDYPNEFDRRMALRDHRSTLGGDIMIHGNEVSIGCLAMGDEAAEDLFILAAQVGKERTRIVVSPTDFRVRSHAPSQQLPIWTRELYAELRSQLRQYPSPSL
jgi:hypothetical protein